MSQRRILALVVFFAALAWVSFMVFGPRQNPASAAPQLIPPEKKDDKRHALTGVRAALAGMIETKDFQNPLTLKETLGILYEYSSQQGRDFPILVDVDAFREENPDADPIYDTAIQFPPYPKKVSIATALQLMLRRVRTNNATYLARGSYIEITTFVRAQPEAQTIHASFFRRPLHEALEELSEQTGISIVLDSRADKKGSVPITASFPPDTGLICAVQILADMADLKVMVVDNLLYVTLPSNNATFTPFERPGRPVRFLAAQE